MNSIPNSAGFTLPGGKIGVLVIHGFTSTPISIAPWAKFLNNSGYTVIAPLLPGHGTTWQQMNQTTWQQWYEEVEKSFLQLKQSCDRVFIAGFSMGGALALRLCQIRGSEVEGLIVLNPSVHDKRWFMKLLPVLKFLIGSVAKGPTDVAAPNPPLHSYARTPLKALDSLRNLWKLVERDLYLIDLPIMVAYSVNDHAVDEVDAEQHSQALDWRTTEGEGDQQRDARDGEQGARSERGGGGCTLCILDRWEGLVAGAGPLVHGGWVELRKKKLRKWVYCCCLLSQRISFVAKRILSMAVLVRLLVRRTRAARRYITGTQVHNAAAGASANPYSPVTPVCPCVPKRASKRAKNH